jgi:hypothetical protein
MGAIRIQISPQPTPAVGQSVVPAGGSRFTLGERARWLAETVAAAQTLGRQLPNVLVSLLTPAALVALAMGLWRIGSDLGWASDFPIAAGFFSHWQVWIALSIGLKMLSSFLLAWDSRTRKMSEEN